MQAHEVRRDHQRRNQDEQGHDRQELLPRLGGARLPRHFAPRRHHHPHGRPGPRPRTPAPPRPLREDLEQRPRRRHHLRKRLRRHRRESPRSHLLQGHALQGQRHRQENHRPLRRVDQSPDLRGRLTGWGGQRSATAKKKKEPTNPQLFHKSWKTDRPGPTRPDPDRPLPPSCHPPRFLLVSIVFFFSSLVCSTEAFGDDLEHQRP
mmetsp:Transcript_7734/g.25391  ORF Transcript_7734/g.25391 Transcript_7734/m.25391 type:complete len:206 (+) Transcript_7734:736-1353(+)